MLAARAHDRPEQRRRDPPLGFGVFQIPPDDTAKATLTALEMATGTSTPRRCTATRGRSGAPCASRLDRDEIFVTSKVNNNRLDRDDMLRSFDQTLKDPGLRLARPAARALAAARRGATSTHWKLWRRSTPAAGQGHRRLQLQPHI